jgi:uncharacterized cupin superfamily protein
MSKPFVNIADAPVGRTLSHGEYFDMKMVPLAAPLGAKQIGANVTTVPPGKAAFPFHHHYANEEHFLVLRGRGVLRVGAQAWPVREGDYIVNPAGGPEHAHQLINTGDVELQYLALSTMRTPEVVGYPDSRKTGVRPEPYSDTGKRWLIRDELLGQAQYFDGEDGAAVRAILDRNK